jgi:hypothetical protein
MCEICLFSQQFDKVRIVLEGMDFIRRISKKETVKVD